MTPTRKEVGLIDGELWIDAATGYPVLLTGQLAKAPTGLTERPHLVQTVILRDGVPSVRVTHVRMKTKLIGRGELTITESRPIDAATALPSSEALRGESDAWK